MDKYEKLTVAVVSTMISVSLAVMAIAPWMESRTYNRLTGAKTTWWDALWVQLRVQDQPIQSK